MNYLDHKGELEQELNRMASKGKVDINSDIVRDAIWAGYRLLNAGANYVSAVNHAKHVLIAGWQAQAGIAPVGNQGRPQDHFSEAQ